MTSTPIKTEDASISGENEMLGTSIREPVDMEMSEEEASSKSETEILVVDD